MNSFGDIVNNIFSVCFVVGMLLFIWYSVVSRNLKIIVTVYIIIKQFLIKILTQISMQSMPKDYPEGGPTDFIRMQQSMSAIIMFSVIIGIIFFILIFRIVSQWRKQPTDINIENK